jgi:hypothetical protein
MIPGRRRTLPTDVAALQEDHGKALAWGRSDTGGIIIATAAALVIDAEPARILPWDRIDRASWEPPQLRLQFRDPDSGKSERMGLVLAEHGELPPVIHQRVTLSVVTSRRVELLGGVGAVLAARRNAKGAVTWTVVFDAGADPSDPELQQAARQALTQFRESLGV